MLRAILLVALAATLGPAGCRPKPEESPEVRLRQSLVQVIDETEFLAQAAQVEGQVLDNLWRLLAAADPKKPASQLAIPGVIEDPAKYRGAKVIFRGKLLEISTPAGGTKGLVLLPDGGVAAFRCAPGAKGELPAVGSAVEVTGLFMKRWIALDGSGSRYAMIPLAASGLPLKLSGDEAASLVKLEPARGLMPITELDVPRVATRPVVTVDADGTFRLDGRAMSMGRLSEHLKQLAASTGRTPFGESALVAVVVTGKGAPQAGIERLRKELPVKAVFRAE